MGARSVVFLIGLTCSLIASIMAYVITYEEYADHFAERKRTAREAFSTALVTFVFFAVLSLILGFLL